MLAYTVVYMGDNRITYYRQIECKPGMFAEAWEDAGFCMSQIWLVFPGKQLPVTLDWSLL